MKQPLLLEPGFSLCGPLDYTTDSRSDNRNTPFTPQEIEDRFWMTEALKTSVGSMGISNPNPAVGCVLVDACGKEITRGATQAYRGLHAERAAFTQISDLTLLEGATAYVTLEPCSHTGHQPPCADLLASSPLRRVVIASGDPNPLVHGEGIRKLQAAGKVVETGLFQAEARAIHFPFFIEKILKRPAVALKWAQTLDGQLADDTEQSQWISGPASRVYTHRLRQRYDAILVGARTFLADQPSLTVREYSPAHRADPFPILFDPQGLCLTVTPSVQATLREKSFLTKRPSLYVTTCQVRPQDSPSWLKQIAGVHFLTLNDPGNPLEELITFLGSEAMAAILGRPFQSLLVEGGAKTLSGFLKAGFADLLHVFIAPLLTGGIQHHIQLSKSLKEAQTFHLAASHSLSHPPGHSPNSDLLLEMISHEALRSTGIFN